MKKSAISSASAVLDSDVNGPQIEMWPLARIKPYPKNARNRTAAAIGKIVTSIREFGFVQPIVVDDEGVIIIGHGRLEAAQFMELDAAPVIVARGLSPAKVKALRLADNRAHEESSWNFDLLGSELLDLKVIGVDLDTTGFEIGEIVNGIFGAAGKKKKKQSSDANNDAGLEFRVVVDCVDEEHQTMLLAKFKDEGLKCRALIS